MIGIVKNEFRRRLWEEGFDRIQKCVGELSEKEIWHQENKNVNSIGNLIMHLEGNVRQYIVSGIGGVKDNRNRDSEFNAQNIKPLNEIIDKLKTTIHESIETINNLEEKNLTEKRKVQGFDESVLSIIIHVIEHFSYHVGQITFYVKYTKNIDTGYYAGLDLNITD